MITHNGCALSADTYAPDIYSRETYRRTCQENFLPALNENYWRDEEMNYRNMDSPTRCGRPHTFKPTMIHSLNPKSSQPKVCARPIGDDKNLTAYKLVSEKYVSPLPETTTSYPIKNCFNARRFQKHLSSKAWNLISKDFNDRA
ncbi:hypothetical protein M9H77_00522 [Catharanthus roseus]|nr:hypothetical protein M9H77_00522 [Catharanthus roseus]